MIASCSEPPSSSPAPPRHRPRHRAARRRRRRQHRHRRQDDRAASEAAGHDPHRGRRCRARPAARRWRSRSTSATRRRSTRRSPRPSTRFGGIDILVNNASAISLTGTLDTPMKRFDLMHQVNTRGTFLCTQKAVPHLAKSANPHVLNLSPPLHVDARARAGSRRTSPTRWRSTACRCACSAWRRSFARRASPSTRCGRARRSTPRRSG